MIRQEFQVRLSEVSVGRLLKKLGLSPQKPLRRAYEQNTAAVQTWRETVYPALRAQVRRFVEGTQGRLRLYWLPTYSPELNPDELM